MTSRPSSTGIAWMCGAAASFAGMSASIKVTTETLSPWHVLLIRSLLSVLLILAIEAALRRPLTRPARHRGLLLLRSLLGFITMTLYILAISRIDLAFASALNQASPIFVVLLSVALLRERPHPLVIPFTAAGFVGVWLVLSPDLRRVDPIAALALASAVTAAAAYVLVPRLRATESTWTIFRWFILGQGIMALPFGLVPGWTVPSFAAVLGLLGATVFGLTGHLALTRAYAIGPSSTVGPFIYLTVPLNVVLGVALWSELPGPVGWAGIGVLGVSTTALLLLRPS